MWRRRRRTAIPEPFAARTPQNMNRLRVLTHRGEATDLGRLPPAETILTHELADKNIWTLAQSDMQQIRNIEKE
jgi:hypothetical protein